MNVMRILMCLSAITFLAGCATMPERPTARAVLSAQVNDAVAVFKIKDPGIDRFFSQSYGYTVLPRVFKGAFWVGGAYGRGEVYEQGRMVGYCDMKQASLGFSFGGEYFREIIFFRRKEDLNRFKMEEYTFAAQVTAVAATSGAAAKADYMDGMAVFITADKGLMVDASVGGQEFKFVPVFIVEDTTKK